MNKKFLIANWKMNPGTLGEAETLARAVATAKSSRNLEVVLCPPFTYLPAISKVLNSKSSILNSFSLGAQDVFWESRGPYTGEISPAMLKDSGAKYVILGHSERRRYLGETDEMVAKKAAAATVAGLAAVLCVGEPWEVRRRGVFAYKEFVSHQLERDLKLLPRARGAMKNRLIVTYEPVWAISTNEIGKPCTPEDAADMADFIGRFVRERFKLEGVPVIYGGSVDAKNIKQYLKRGTIRGALVGGASLKAAEFQRMIKISSGI